MINIRRATISDIEQLVHIHNDAFTGFFLTSLGSYFLSFYYTCFIKSTEGIIICAEENGMLIGFAAATQSCKGFNKCLIKKNPGAFCLLVTRLLFTNPKSLIRLAKNMTKTRKDIQDMEDYAELFSIAVKNNNQGKGVGKKLLSAVESSLKEVNINRLSLTTDYYANDATLTFYKSLKFKILYEFIAYPQRKMYRLIKEL